jgi:hypothetical protein
LKNIFRPCSPLPCTLAFLQTSIICPFKRFPGCRALTL